MSILNATDKVLIIAPHCDDEILGCGGTIKYLSEIGIDITLFVATGPGEGNHPIWPNEVWQVIRNESKKAADIVGINRVVYGNLPAVSIPDIEVFKLNEEIDSIIKKIEANVIFLPWMGDMHKDHESICYSVAVSLRPHLQKNRNLKLIAAYEVLSETDLAIKHPGHRTFEPNLYFNITEHINHKVEAMKCYESQLSQYPSPRSIEAIKALAKLRGVHIGKEFAEAFSIMYCLES